MESITELIEQNREKLLDEIAERARRLQANAIVGMTFETGVLYEGGGLGMTISGTAVYIKK